MPMYDGLNHNNRKWTDERLDCVRLMWGQGHTASAIARALGSTRGAVMGVIHRNYMRRGLPEELTPEPEPEPEPEPQPEPPPPVLHIRAGGCECGGTCQPYRNLCDACIRDNIQRRKHAGTAS